MQIVLCSGTFISGVVRCDFVLVSADRIYAAIIQRTTENIKHASERLILIFFTDVWMDYLKLS